MCSASTIPEALCTYGMHDVMMLCNIMKSFCACPTNTCAEYMHSSLCKSCAISLSHSDTPGGVPCCRVWNSAAFFVFLKSLFWLSMLSESYIQYIMSLSRDFFSFILLLSLCFLSLSTGSKLGGRK